MHTTINGIEALQLVVEVILMITSYDDVDDDGDDDNDDDNDDDDDYDDDGDDTQVHHDHHLNREFYCLLSQYWAWLAIPSL